MNKLLEYFNISANDAVSAIINIVLILIVFICLAKLLSVFFKRAEKKMLMHNNGANVGPIRFIKYLCIIIIAIFCISSIVSYFPAMNKLFNSLLAGSGVIALIISVASQDAISNIVGGALILFSKPFKIGDTVKYIDKDIAGVVEEITLRHTVIRTFENKRLIIPNSTINNSVIENYDYTDKRVCTLLNIGVTYESDIDKAVEIFSDVITSHPNYMDCRTEAEKAANVSEPKIRVLSFDDSAITIRGWIWSKNIDAAVDMKSDILKELRNRYNKSGIDFAYPHMVIVPKQPDTFHN